MNDIPTGTNVYALTIEAGSRLHHLTASSTKNIARIPRSTINPAGFSLRLISMGFRSERIFLPAV